MNNRTTSALALTRLFAAGAAIPAQAELASYDNTTDFPKSITTPDKVKTTWQTYAGIGYRFSKVDLELACRHIEWDFDDLNFSGPFAGLNFRF